MINNENNYLNISAKIEKITNFGKVHLLFNETMKPNFTKELDLLPNDLSFLNESIMLLKIVPSGL